MSVTLLLTFLLNMFANEAAFNAIDEAGGPNDVKIEKIRKIKTDDDGGWSFDLSLSVMHIITSTNSEPASLKAGSLV